MSMVSKARKRPIFPDLQFEDAALQNGFSYIAGVDEAGRGPFAGPVCAAAVILDTENIPGGLRDSKKLSEKKREALYEEIVSSAHVGIATASPQQIDAMNIRAASLWAMVQAIKALPAPADYALIDGRDVPTDIPLSAEAIIKGDDRSLSISAASIVAKVTRDRMMIAAGRFYPQYGFAKHKGYGTAFHQAALAEHGPCPLHRRSFKPIRDLLNA